MSMAQALDWSADMYAQGKKQTLGTPTPTQPPGTRGTPVSIPETPAKGPGNCPTVRDQTGLLLGLFAVQGIS
jgi:hypothetical protein